MTALEDALAQLDTSHETFWGTRSFLTISVPHGAYDRPPPHTTLIRQLEQDGWTDVGGSWTRVWSERPNWTEVLMICPYVNHPPEPRHFAHDGNGARVDLDPPAPELVSQVVAVADWIATHVDLWPTEGNVAVDQDATQQALDALPDWADIYAEAVFWAKTQYTDIQPDSVLITFSVKDEYRGNVAREVARLTGLDIGITITDGPMREAGA